jgi:hypothetical protein
MKAYKISIVVCLIFLLTAPIGQAILPYFVGYLISEVLPYSISEIALQLMVVLSLLSLVGFYVSKRKFGQVSFSILSTLFISNTLLFYSLENRTIPELFYSDRFVVGALVSLVILVTLTVVKKKI